MSLDRAQYEFHPIAALFPMMGAEEMDSMRADIKANGLREPIWLYEGKILDGRNRYIACTELRIAVATREYTGDSPAAFSLSMNLERRQLTQSQRAAIASEAKSIFAAEARERMVAGLKQGTESPAPPDLVERGPKGEAIDHAAKLMGVSKTLVGYADRIKRVAPERMEEIRSGERTVDSMYREVFDKPRAAPPAVESGSHFESVRGHKEHRVTAMQAIEKLLRDTEPVFKFGFWSLVDANINTVDPVKAAELKDRAAKCRTEFSKLIHILEERAKSS